jgi:hypothetical protein
MRAKPELFFAEHAADFYFFRRIQTGTSSASSWSDYSSKAGPSIVDKLPLVHAALRFAASAHAIPLCA